MYFGCIFIPIWQHCLQYTATLCTVLSFALAHFAKLDSVLWGKLEKLCQFKVVNSTKQTLYFLGFKRKMHHYESVSAFTLNDLTWSVMSMLIMLPMLLSSFPCFPPACSITTWLISWEKRKCTLLVQDHFSASAVLQAVVHFSFALSAPDSWQQSQVSWQSWWGYLVMSGEPGHRGDAPGQADPRVRVTGECVHVTYHVSRVADRHGDTDIRLSVSGGCLSCQCLSCYDCSATAAVCVHCSERCRRLQGPSSQLRPGPES